jgi:predicted secreted acid phosphatase
MSRWIAVLMLLCCWSGRGQQTVVAVPFEPRNLYAVKQHLKTYHSCAEPTCYVPQLEYQADVAIQFLKQSVAAAKPGEKLALVLDIDETSLSNWDVEVQDDFGYIPNDSNQCISRRCGKVIASTLRIFQEAEHDHVAIFFITGRPECQRADTKANLEAVGYDHWEGLFLRPDIPCPPKTPPPGGLTVEQYKSGERAKIAKGYRIVLNVGDQMSDLVGDPQAEHSVKLPNPFYFIP